MERLFSTNQYSSVDRFEKSFEYTTERDSQYPMRLFLDSDAVDIHPSNSCYMRDFFKQFDIWCIENGYGKQPHQSYTFLWSQYRIKTGRPRLMFGISLNS